MDRSIVSRLMKPLVEMALVEARPDELDGRVVRYGLSALGRARVASAIANKDNAYRRRLQGWSDEDLATLAELLRKTCARPGRRRARHAGPLARSGADQDLSSARRARPWRHKRRRRPGRARRTIALRRLWASIATACRHGRVGPKARPEGAESSGPAS